MSTRNPAVLARVALLTGLLAGTVRCAPALALAPSIGDAAAVTAAQQVSASLPAIVGEEIEGPPELAPRPRVSIDVVRARVNSKRQIVAIDGAKPSVDPRVAAVARELAAKGQPLVGTELKLVFATASARNAAPSAGRLVAVQIGSGAKARRAFHVVDEQAGIDGFYDASGRPLERRFLRYPVAHLIISSGFSMQRKHPITKKNRPHLGVDFAAPRGTPVIAVGDGEVIHATWDGPFGRHVKIRHGSEYVSGYAHLERIATGLRAGSRVKRGQVIGYVGATGLATGPHLHFGLLRNGKYVDPLTTALPAAPLLAEPALRALRAAVGDVELALTATSAEEAAVRVAKVR